MYYEEKNNMILLKDIDSFHIAEILECGQCFRYIKLSEHVYRIIAFEKVLTIKQEGNEVSFYPCTTEEFEKLWLPYFDLEGDYQKVNQFLTIEDPIMAAAIEYAPGIRILNQDPFECLISFIISQNRKIPMIQHSIESIALFYGKPILEDLYSFPTPEALFTATEEGLKDCKTGFRYKYILDAVTKVYHNTIDLHELSALPTARLGQRLMEIYGVGQKVADCVMLFSFGRTEVFPIDVWVQRIMQYYYFKEEPQNMKTIHQFAQKKWGCYAGFAQQYLFHYARMQKIGAKPSIKKITK